MLGSRPRQKHKTDWVVFDDQVVSSAMVAVSQRHDQSASVMISHPLSRVCDCACVLAHSAGQGSGGRGSGQVDIFVCRGPSENRNFSCEHPHGHASPPMSEGPKTEPDSVITLRPSINYTLEMGELYDSLHESLTLPYTRIRSGKVLYLLHALLAKLVGSLSVAVKKFGELLQEHQVNLHGKQSGTGDANNLLMIDQDLLHIHTLQHKLLKLQLTLRGVPSTLKSIMSDPVLGLPSDMQVLFQRVANRASEINSEVRSLSALADLLEEEYESRRDYIHGEANTLLAIMVTICLPLQAVSGLWGVNVTVPFQTGKTDDHLWPFFVICAGSLLLALACIVVFRIKGWW
eukprot:TRINITY_DN19017_c0_g2_i1.p1 TRINITY_DN19017_c0_g2~~TRINITY_DN19017_c0_g2_i1.p1  ORF type:complete len:346 (-),score=64.61 TRINITY_DN19017_c0_g2_i1:163-1200(-)